MMHHRHYQHPDHPHQQQPGPCRHYHHSYQKQQRRRRQQNTHSPSLEPFSRLPPSPPPSANDMPLGYAFYKKHVLANRTLFACPHHPCQRYLVSQQYELHCTWHHGLDARSCCVWCHGAVSFKSQQKQNNALHLLACWRKFLEVCPRTVPIRLCRTHPSPTLENWSNLPCHAYDVLWPAPLRGPLLTFKNVALNPAVAAVQLFLENHVPVSVTTSSSSNNNNNNKTTTTTTTTTSIQSTLQWFHVAVIQKGFPRFRNAMEKHQGQFRTLPHSCWCMLQNGAGCHRHLIVVAVPLPDERDAFVKHITNPMSKFIQMIRITSPYQLVTTIGNVSGHQYQQHRYDCDRCPMTGVPLKASLILEPLPKGYRLPLLMQWDGGLLEDPTFQKQVRQGITQWMALKLKARLNVSDDFVTSNRPTDYWLHFIQGEKLYFERREDPTAETAAAAAAAAEELTAVAAAIETIDLE